MMPLLGTHISHRLILFDFPFLVFPLELFLISTAFTFDCLTVVLSLLPTTPRPPLLPTTLRPSLLPSTPPPSRKLWRFKFLVRVLFRQHWRQNLARDDAACLLQPSVAQTMCVTLARRQTF